jgi:hypothetical protein
MTCPSCHNGKMVRKTSDIRIPDVWLKCDNAECGAVVDMTPEQAHGLEPKPSWA